MNIKKIGMISDLSSFDYSYDSYTEDQMKFYNTNAEETVLPTKFLMRKYKQRRYIF